MNIGKKLFPPTANLNISTMNVIGENNDMNNAFDGSNSKGIKIPLINKIGNFKIFIVTITSEVFSVGFADINIPNKKPITPNRIIARKIIKIEIRE